MEENLSFNNNYIIYGFLGTIYFNNEFDLKLRLNATKGVHTYCSPGKANGHVSGNNEKTLIHLLLFFIDKSDNNNWLDGSRYGNILFSSCEVPVCCLFFMY